jgi:hypothetical protein
VVSSRWVFVYDARRNTGYILVTSQTTEEREMRFHVEWQPTESASNGMPAAVGSGQ